MLHSLPISVFLIPLPKLHFMTSRKHKAPCYVVFSTPCYLIPLRPKYLPQHPILKNPQPIMPPSMSATTFHTCIKQPARLQFCVS
jgi:hypothetical protein